MAETNAAGGDKPAVANEQPNALQAATPPIAAEVMTGEGDGVQASGETPAALTPAEGEGGDGAQPLTKPADGEQIGGEAATGDAEGAPHSRIPGRIAQLLGERNAAVSFAERQLAEVQRLQAQVANAPRREDFATDAEYLQATAAHAVSKAQSDIAARQAAEARERAEAAGRNAWAERTAEIRARVADFEAVAHNPNLAVTPVMAEAIRESDLGGEIAYYLGKNPSEAARIASLAPVSQATAIARLEARVSKAAPAAKSQSKAPPPPSKPAPKAGAVGKSLEDMSFEDYRKARGF